MIIQSRAQASTDHGCVSIGKVSICAPKSFERLRVRPQLEILQMPHSTYILYRAGVSANGALSGWKCSERLLTVMVGLGGQHAEVGCSVVATPSLASDGHVHLWLSANRKAKPNLVNETRIGGKVGVCVIVMAYHPQASTPLLTTARFDKKEGLDSSSLVSRSRAIACTCQYACSDPAHSQARHGLRAVTERNGFMCTTD